MNKRFRLAIVGCGRIARSAHVPAILASRRARLTALVDPVPGRAQALVSEFGIDARIATQVREALDSVDGAIIATPNRVHCAIALECLEAGVPVLVEKPVAISVAEGEQIVRVAERHNLTVAVGYATRFYRSIRLMHSLLCEGYFGDVRRFAYQFGTKGGWSPLSGYSLDHRATGGGTLVVTGTHFLDRMLHWFGRPDEVSLEDDSRGGLEANAVARFRYRREGTCEGVARFSKTVSLAAGFAMDTESGTVTLEDRPDANIVLRPSGQPSIQLAIESRASASSTRTNDHNVLQLENFVESCETMSPPMVSARDGLESLRLVEALYAHRQPMGSDWYKFAREGVSAR